MIDVLKYLASKLTHRQQQLLKRLHYALQLRRGRFFTDEQEYALLSEWIDEGDTVLDVGANIGHYTARFSDLVGSGGRVIAFEPIMDTFELLSANVAQLPLDNVTLINAAASDGTQLVGMSTPEFATGLKNYYMSQVTSDSADRRVLSLAVDSLQLMSPVKLVKMDVEGHEFAALSGMRSLLERDHPVLVVEGDDGAVEQLLQSVGYAFRKLPGSSNRIYEAA